MLDISSKGIHKNFIKYLDKILNDEIAKAKNISILSEEKLEKENENTSPNEMKIYDELANKYFGKDKNSKKFDKIVSVISKINKIKKLYTFSIQTKNSYYGRFSKDLKNYIVFGEKIKNQTLIDDLNFVLNQLNIIFFQPFQGKKPNAPIVTENLAKQLKDMKNDFQDKIEDFMKVIDSLYSNQNNISVRLKNSLTKLKSSLIDLKNNNNTDEKKPQSNNSFLNFFHDIFSSFLLTIDFSSDWIKIKDKFKIAFEKQVDNFIKIFKEIVNDYTNNINSNYRRIKIIFDENYDFLEPYFYLEKLKNAYKYIEFRKFIKNIIDKDTSKDLERVLVDIKNDILEGAEKSLDYEHSKNFFEWAHKKLSNSKYLNTYFDYIIKKSGLEFEDFILCIEDNSNDYFENIIKDPIRNLGGIYIDCFNAKINLEIENAKKEFDDKKKIYDKEKKKYEQEQKVWNKTCEDYKKIGRNLEKYVNEISQYIERGLYKNTENNNKNIIKEEEYISEDEPKEEIISKGKCVSYQSKIGSDLIQEDKIYKDNPKIEQTSDSAVTFSSSEARNYDKEKSNQSKITNNPNPSINEVNILKRNDNINSNIKFSIPGKNTSNIQPKIEQNNYMNNNISSARYTNNNRRVIVESQNWNDSRYNYNVNNVQTQPNNYAHHINSQRTNNYNVSKTESNFQENGQRKRFGYYRKNSGGNNGNNQMDNNHY